MSCTCCAVCSSLALTEDKHTITRQLRAGFVFLPGSRKLEDAIGGIPELRELAGKILALLGGLPGERDLALAFQCLVEIRANAIEL